MSSVISYFVSELIVRVGKEVFDREYAGIVIIFALSA
jgi:hypothetical protein